MTIRDKLILMDQMKAQNTKRVKEYIAQRGKQTDK